MTTTKWVQGLRVIRLRDLFLLAHRGPDGLRVDEDDWRVALGEFEFQIIQRPFSSAIVATSTVLPSIWTLVV